MKRIINIVVCSLILAVLCPAQTPSNPFYLQWQNNGTPIYSSANGVVVNFLSGCSFANGVVTCTAGGGSPGGANTNVQYNDSTAFGGDAGFTYNKSTHNAVLTGSMSATSFIGTAGGGVGNYWLCAEGTDPGNESAGKDLLYCDSAAHAILMSLNGSAVAANAIPGMNQANTAGSTFTLDMHSASVTTGLKPPAGAGANPTADGAVAWDTTNHTFLCGDGTNTNHCTEYPLIAGGGNGSVPASTSDFMNIMGAGTPNASEATKQLGFPFTGVIRKLCVRTTSTQSAAGSLTIILHNATTNADVSGLSVVFVANTVASQICDTTNTSAVIAGNAYTWKVTEGVTNASATITDVSAIYRY